MSALILGASGFASAAVLTFAIPIGTLMLAIAYGFYQRKPPVRSRRTLYPSVGLPQYAHDLRLLSAMTPEAREDVASRADEGTALLERPLGGR